MNLHQEVQKFPRILIRLPNWVGDIVMAMPSLQNIRTAFPDHELIVTGKPFCRDILEASNLYDQFIPRPALGQGFLTYFRYISQLSQLKPCAGMLLTNSLSSAFDFFLARISLRLGYQNEGRSVFLTDGIPKQSEPMDQYYTRITQCFGASPKTKELILGLDERTRRSVRVAEQKYDFNDEDKFIGLNPGAGYGESKKWPKESFVELAKLILHERPKTRFFVFGGPGDEDRADFISSEIGENAINLSRESPGLHCVKGFIERLDLFITSDSGLRWYSVALKKPTLVLFGPSDPDLTHCHLDNYYPLRNPVSCSPCKFRVCPVGFECMRGLTPQKVMECIRKLGGEQEETISQ
jgi:heptosyltransferase II